jgi:putative FmdB family regulatory protein
MPFYTFRCPSCNKEQEVLQKMNEPEPVCERCINASCGVHIVEMKRVFNNIGKPQFKGSGFYETDYKSKKKDT